MAGMARIILADIIAYRLFPFARFGDHMDQAHIVHFLGAINLAPQDHSFSMNMADATGENGIGAHAGEQAEEDFRQTEAGLSFSDDDRSEEHTSELQSLMRNSYAVFCLTNTTFKKNKQKS